MKHVFSSQQKLYVAWILGTTTHAISDSFYRRGGTRFSKDTPVLFSWSTPIALRVSPQRYLVLRTPENQGYIYDRKIDRLLWALSVHKREVARALSIPWDNDITNTDWLQGELTETQELLLIWKDKASRARAKKLYWIRLATERYAEFQKLMEWTGRKGVGEYELRRTMDEIERMKNNT